MTTFRKWPSIENTYQQKHIDWWILRHPGLVKAEYVITEKLHGSNVQVHVEPDGAVSFGTRNDFAIGSALFGWPANRLDVIPGFTGLIAKMVTSVEYYGQDVTLYGEIIGPGVQKGVYYGDTKAVRFFGWRIADSLQGPLSDGTFYGIETVPIVGIVKGLEAALAFDTEFSSKVAEADDNLCEGIVIQPRMPVRDGDSWFLLKKKNEAFKERQREKKARTPDEVVDPLNAAFREYVTEQRMDNVFSKEGSIEDKSQIGKYIGLILVDAIGDFTKDYPEVETLDKKQRKAVFNVGSIVAKMLIMRL